LNINDFIPEQFRSPERYLTGTIRISDIEHDSVVNGPGVRTVVYVQGCKHECPGCHNPTTHDFTGGYQISIKELVQEVNRNKFKCVTWSGGDPAYRAMAIYVANAELKRYNFNIWSYTGFTIEQLLLRKHTYDTIPFLSNLDVLIDGPYIEALRSLEFPFRGSTNQRIIDVKPTLNSFIAGNLTVTQHSNYPEATCFGQE
jgi:anaerobic ribonucleoside-triphosphate reductase activating protein